MSNIYKYIDNNIPISRQTHSNNEFNNEGESVPVLSELRRKYCYPDYGETRFFLHCLKNGTPVVIRQEYRPPAGSRPDDEITVFKITDMSCECDNKILSEMASDFFFHAHCISCDHDIKHLIQTWVLFCQVVSAYPNLSLHNYVCPVNAENYDNIDVNCLGLTFEKLKTAAAIFSNLNNTENNKEKAFRLASVEISDYRNITDSGDLDTIVKYSNDTSLSAAALTFLLRRNHYSENVNSSDILVNSAAQEIIMEDYVNYLIQRDEEKTINAEKYIHNTTFYNLAKFEHKLNILSEMTICADTDSLFFILHIVFLCTKFSNEKTKDYIKHFFKLINADQVFRHKILIYLNDHQNYYSMFKYYSNDNFRNEISLLQGNYEKSSYLHDAYYLNIISYSLYKNLSANYQDGIYKLVNIAKTDLENNNLKNIMAFMRSADRSFRKKFRKLLISEINRNAYKKIKNAFTSLVKEIKKMIYINIKL